jgi:hypothetical protein
LRLLVATTAYPLPERDGLDLLTAGLLRGELDATASFEVYSQSAAARTIAIATTDTIRTRHGLVLLTTPLTHAPRLSRVVVPGAGKPDAIDPRLRTWADSQRLTVAAAINAVGVSGCSGELAAGRTIENRRVEPGA